MKILQRNLNGSTFIAWEMKRNVFVVRLIVATWSSGPPASQPVSCLTRLSAYTEIFNTFVNQLDDEELSTGYFQQDEATSHTSQACMAEIQYFFGDRVISKGLWLPRSPDNFLWGYLNGRVYQNKPRTTIALKANITEEIQVLAADVLARTFQNMARRVQSCLDANGGHFQHMLWCRHISYTMR